MVSEVMSMLGIVIQTVLNWFVQVLEYTQGTGAWITALLVVMSYKFLLSPIFGHMKYGLGSDTVRKFKRRGDE